MLAVKIVFGILLTLAGIVLILISFLRFWEYCVQEKRCTAKTKGEVIGYSLDTPPLPRVRYSVDAKTYKVVGPRYRAVITKTSKTPSAQVNGDVQFFVDEKQRLHIDVYGNSFASIIKSPLTQLYPIGKTVDVYYDTKNPQNSFVERYRNLKWIFWLTFLFGIVCIIGAVLLTIFIS